jgi:membrane protease YdiL (CAAX protease family)
MPERVNRRSGKQWGIFGVVFIIAFAAWYLSNWKLNLGFGPLIGLVPSLAIALLISGPLSNRRGVHEMLAEKPLRTSWKWYIAAIILGAVIWLFPIGVDLLLGGQTPPWPQGAPTFVTVLACAGWVLFFDGASEEPGWRGFALPRLQQKFSPLVASIILGFFWAMWHLPLYFVGMYTESSNTGPTGLFGILSRIGWVIPLAIIFTWFYNLSRNKSVLAMALVHASFNTSNAVVGLSARATFIFMGTTWLFAILFIIISRMWRKSAGEPAAKIAEAGMQPG